MTPSSSATRIANARSIGVNLISLSGCAFTENSHVPKMHQSAVKPMSELVRSAVIDWTGKPVERTCGCGIRS